MKIAHIIVASALLLSPYAAAANDPASSETKSSADAKGELDQAWSSAMDAAVELLKAGKRDAATAKLNEALKLSDAFAKGDYRKAVTLTRIAENDIESEHFIDADRELQQAIDIFSKNEKDNQLYLASAYNFRGMLLMREKKFEQAVAPLEKTVSIYIKELGIDDENLLAPLQNQAITYMMLEKNKEAADAYRRLLPIAERKSGAKTHEMAVNLKNYAYLNSLLKQNLLAEENYKLAAAAEIEANGPKSTYLAKIYRSYSSLLTSMERASDAAMYLKMANEIAPKQNK
jgi:tetratricopeptide (TPR) repeat protein